MLYWILRPIVQGIIWAFFGFRSFDAQNVPVRTGAVLASNHQSYLDPMLLGMGLFRRVRFVARTTLFRNPIFGWILRSTGAMAIDRRAADIGTMRAIADSLRSGHLLVMFPEGTRTPDGEVGRCKAGVAITARAAGVPVVPVAIDGAFEAWPKDRALFRLFSPIRVLYGEPVRYRRGLGRREVEEDLRRRIVGLLAELRRRYPRDSGAGRSVIHGLD